MLLSQLTRTQTTALYIHTSIIVNITMFKIHFNKVSMLTIKLTIGDEFWRKKTAYNSTLRTDKKKMVNVQFRKNIKVNTGYYLFPYLLVHIYPFSLSSLAMFSLSDLHIHTTPIIQSVSIHPFIINLLVALSLNIYILLLLFIYIHVCRIHYFSIHT